MEYMEAKMQAHYEAHDDYWAKDIAARLMERAARARQEGTGTAVADAAHFEQAAAEINRLRDVIKPFSRLALPLKPQGNAGLYSIFHRDIAAAKAALREACKPAPVIPEKAPYEVLRAVAWMKVDPKSRRFEDTKGEMEVIGFERAEEIYANIRSALSTSTNEQEDGR